MAVATISVNFATPASVIAGTSYITSINPYSLFTALSSGSLYGLRLGSLSATTFFGDGSNLTGIVKGITVADVPLRYSGVKLESGGNTTGNVILSANFVNDCPPWYVGQLNQPLLSATNAVLPGGLSARFSKQVSLSADFLRHLQYVVSRNTPMTGAETLITPAGTYPGSAAHQGGVLLPDGRVFINPFYSTIARIYDPATNILTTATGSYPGGGAHDGTVMLPDGRVFMVPLVSGIARIYNPSTDTLTTPAGTYTPATYSHDGGVLLPDGRVFCVPHSSTVARIYNPVTNALTTPNGNYPGNQAHQGGVLLPDGRVFCLTFGGATNNIARIYNPRTDTLSTAGGSDTLSASGGCLMADGRVYCCGSNNRARIYNPSTDSFTTPAGTYGACIGSYLLPDGRIFCVPSTSTQAAIYDPRTDTTRLVGNYPGSNAHVMGVVLPGGRVFCVPYNSTVARIQSVMYNTDFSMNALTSPIFNSY